MNKESRLKASVNQKLTETGERDRWVGFIINHKMSSYRHVGTLKLSHKHCTVIMQVRILNVIVFLININVNRI